MLNSPASLLMPLYWIINSRTELVTAVAEGDVPIGDAMAFLRALSGAKVTGYRKLFDGRNGTSSMSAQELLMVTAEIRSHHGLGKVGALAIIAEFRPDGTLRSRAGSAGDGRPADEAVRQPNAGAQLARRPAPRLA